MGVNVGIFNPDDIPRDPRRPITTAEALSRLPDRERLLVWFPHAHGHLGRQAKREEVAAKLASRPAYHPCGEARFLLRSVVVEFVDDDGVTGWVSTEEPGERIARAWARNPEPGELLIRDN